MVKSVYVGRAGKIIDFPDTATPQQMLAYIDLKYPQAPTEAPPPEEPVGALESGFYRSLGSLEAAGGKTAQAVGLESLSQYLLDEARKSQEYAAKYQPEISDISQIGGVGDVASFAGSTIAQSLPETAVGVGGAYTGALVGAPLGPVGAAVGGIIGGAIASLPFFVGSNLQRQAEERGVPLEETELGPATIGAVIQSPLDAAFETLVARKLPGAGAALDVVKKGFLKEVAGTAGKAAVTEALTEPAQQAIELAQANPEKLLEFGPDVQREILNAAAAGALAGGAIGGVAGGIGAIGGPSETPEQRAAKIQLAGEMAAGRKRTEELKRFGEINSGVDALAAQPVIGRLKLRKVVIEPTKDNKLKVAIDRSQIVTPAGKVIAEFSDPANAAAAVDRYKKLANKNIILEQMDTGEEIPTAKITPTVTAPTIAPQAPEITPAAPIAPVQPPAPTSQDLRSVGKAGAAIVDNMYEALWDRAKKGDVTEAGAPSALLQAAKIVRDSGGLQSLGEFKQFAKEVGSIERDPNFQQAIRDVVGRYVPKAPEAATEAAPEPTSVAPIGAVEPATETAPKAPEAVAAPTEVTAEELADVVAVDEAQQAAIRQQLEERNAKVAEAARSSLARFGLKDVDTKFVPAFMNGLRIAATRGTETRVQGKSLVTIATGIYDPDLTTEELVSKVVSVMDHEAIHSLTTLGLLRDAEMSMLLDAAATTKVPGKAFTYLDVAKSIYEPLARTNPVYRNPEAIREEAVAEMFRDWREKKLGPPKEVRGLINRIFDALRGMFNSMRRENYATVFKRIETGEVGARPRGSKAQMKDTRTLSEEAIRVAAEPELRSQAPAPNYPYEQRVPEINAEQINNAVNRVDYGAAVDFVMNAFESRLFKATGLSRIMPKRESVVEFYQNFVDKMLPLGLMVDYIKKNGGTVPDALDVYMQEDLMRSKVGESLRQRTEDLYNPFLDYIRKSGIGLENFELYLYARHAEERNRVIRARNPNAPPELGSGMSDQDAREILSEVQNSPEFDLYRTAEELFRRIIDDTNSLRVESGLEPLYTTITIPDGEGNLISIPAYLNYVPLRGFAEENAVDGEIPEEFRARIGQGLKIRGREDKRALGRKSRASDIVAHSMLQNTEAVIRASKNQVGLSLLGLVEANPELAKDYGVYVLESGKKPLKKYLSPEGVVKTMVDPMYKNSDDVMVVKRNGQEIPIKIENRFLQKALLSKNGLSSDGANKALVALQRFNRFLAAMRTAWNPEFMLINFPRDLQTVMISLPQYEIDGVKAAVIKDSVKAIRSVHQILRNPNAQNEWSQWFDDFRKDGGYINGFYGTTTLEDKVREIEKLVQDPSGSAASRVMRGINFIGDALENMNGAFENAIRLSVYKNLIEKANVPRQRAAQVAKNLTVNFDKRGTYGPVLNSLYLFYNASIQGNWALLTAAARSKKVRRAFGALFVMGMVQDLVNSMFSNEDEDGRKVYDKIPDYVLENNIVIIDPTGITEKGYIAIPLQYGLNAFYNAGRASARSMRGEYKTSEAATSMLSVAFDAINPLGGTESYLNFAAPTVVDPFLNLYINIDGLGRKISPTPFPGSVPKADSHQYWSSTSPIYKTTAEYLNAFTGGTEYVPGMIDISPTTLDFAVDFLLGGVGATVRRTYDTATNQIPAVLSGDFSNIEMNNIPVFRKVLGNVSERVTFEDYFEKVNHVLARGEELKSAIKEGDMERIKSVRVRFADELKIYPAVRALANQRNRLASELRKVRENEKIPPEQKRRRQEALQKQIENITERVTKLYEENVDSGYPSLFS